MIITLKTTLIRGMYYDREWSANIELDESSSAKGVTPSWWMRSPMNWRKSGAFERQCVMSSIYKRTRSYPIPSGAKIAERKRTAIRAGSAIVVPAGANHNIVNTGNVALKLYTIYAPPNHRDGVVHHTREDAEADDEHFDGKTTE